MPVALLAAMTLHAAALVFLPGLRPLGMSSPLVLEARLLPAPEVSPPMPAATPALAAAPRTPPPERRPDLPAPARTAEAPAATPAVIAMAAAEPAASPVPAFPAATAEPAPAPPVARIDQTGTRQAEAASSASLEQAIGQYEAALSRAMEARRSYPRMAQERGWQGTTQVRVRFRKGGLLGEVAIARSSGFVVLDERAREMIHGDLPELPPALRQQDFEASIAVVFRLKDR